MWYFPDIPFLMTDIKIKEQVSFEYWKKFFFVCVIFDKIRYVACVINCIGKLICLHAYLHERMCSSHWQDCNELFNREWPLTLNLQNSSKILFSVSFKSLIVHLVLKMSYLNWGKWVLFFMFDEPFRACTVSSQESKQSYRQ